MLTNVFPAIHKPSLGLLSSEPLRALREYAVHRCRKSRDGEGDGHPVIIFPGFCTNDRFIAPLRNQCRSQGYQVVDWGRGYNLGPRGDLSTWFEALTDHTAKLISGFRKRPTLIGWSLGGLYAREVAKSIPTLTRQVITIGSPFNATEDFSNVGWLFRLMGGSPGAFEMEAIDRLRTAPSVPTTSIYSRSDGVVAWQTCLQKNGHPRCQDIEVTGSHLGMPWNASVLRIIEDRLKVQPSQWKPYQS